MRRSGGDASMRCRLNILKRLFETQAGTVAREPRKALYSDWPVAA
jgi:hypothetical protein